MSSAESADLELRRLRWRARRGMLENDLIIERFFDTQAELLLDAARRDAFTQILQLNDNDLFDLLMRVREADALGLPQSDAVREVVSALRRCKVMVAPQAITQSTVTLPAANQA